MPRLSAGLLMYRIKDQILQVLLAHPGGPYFVNKDDGAWTIPKGEPGGHDPCAAEALYPGSQDVGNDSLG